MEEREGRTEEREREMRIERSNRIGLEEVVVAVVMATRRADIVAGGAQQSHHHHVSLISSIWMCV